MVLFQSLASSTPPKKKQKERSHKNNNNSFGFCGGFGGVRKTSSWRSNFPKARFLVWGKRDY